MVIGLKEFCVYLIFIYKSNLLNTAKFVVLFVHINQYLNKIKDIEIEECWEVKYRELEISLGKNKFSENKYFVKQNMIYLFSLQ